MTLLDQDGEPADASGTLTVRVQKADGTDVLAAGTATTNPSGVGTYTAALTAAQTATLEVLTATWSDAADGSTHTTVHEIVGGYYFTVNEAIETDAKISAAPESIRAARRDTEDEFERICEVAFVPRYRRVRVDGKGTTRLILPDPMVRAVRSVRIYTDATTYTSFTAAELAAVTVSTAGIVTRSDGNAWTAGTQNLVVEYEHGHDRPPSEIKRAAIARCRQRLNFGNAGILDRTQTFQATDVGTFGLAQAGFVKVGTDWIDAALARWSMRTPGFA